MSIFTRKTSPNGVLLTDTNCIYVSALSGVDSAAQAGGRENPYQSILFALSKRTNVKQFICIDDSTYSEEINTGIGDTANIRAFLFPNLNFFSVKGDFRITHTTNVYVSISHVNLLGIFNVNYGGWGGLFRLLNSHIHSLESGSATTYAVTSVIKNNVIGSYKLNTFKYVNGASGVDCEWTNNTIIDFFNYLTTASDNIARNAIFVNSIDLKQYAAINANIYPIFYHSLIRKRVQWKWGNIVIPISYSGNKANWINDVKQSLRDFATKESTLSAVQKTYLNTIADNAFQMGTVIHDDINDTPIFNGYDSIGNVIDFTLHENINNPALTMSDMGSYVGALSANIGNMSIEKVINVNADGSEDTDNNPDLLVLSNDSKSLEANDASSQVWNRATTNVIYPAFRSFAFSGLQCKLESGKSQGYYYGKRYADTSLVTETIEVIPYDTANVVSDFPKISCAMTGGTYVFHHKKAPKNGSPVLFKDLAELGVVTNIDLNLYGNYAVTSADYDGFALSALTSVELKPINIRFFKIEINLHYGG